MLRRKIKSDKGDRECGWVVAVSGRMLKEGFFNKLLCKQKSGRREGVLGGEQRP